VGREYRQVGYSRRVNRGVSGDIADNGLEAILC
jgi:hypothetical protein